MSIVIRVGQDAAGTTKTNQTADTHRKNVVDARNLSFKDDKKSLIDAKRDNARNKAMKLISDAWSSDEKRSALRELKNEERAESVLEATKLQAKINFAETEKTALKEKYGIADDSTEQKDLELLMKYRNTKMGASYEEFSEDEISRLMELQSAPLSDYQREVIALNNQQIDLKRQLNEENAKIASLKAESTDLMLEELKNQDMLKAQDAADEIMAAVEKEVMGLLVQEGIDEVNEKAEEAAERIEENAERKEEEKERIEEAKEKRKEEEEIIKNSVEKDKLDMNIKISANTESQVKDAQIQIQKIMDENSMINEDIKGIKIDLDF